MKPDYTAELYEKIEDCTDAELGEFVRKFLTSEDIDSLYTLLVETMAMNTDQAQAEDVYEQAKDLYDITND